MVFYHTVRDKKGGKSCCVIHRVNKRESNDPANPFSSFPYKGIDIFLI